MLIHGVTFTAELNWGKVLQPLGRAFRVLALDQRGHGHGIGPGSRFRLEDCADDVAALAAVLGIERFIAVGYSMGGIVAQLLSRRHPALVSGLVLCATARNVRETPMENLVALTLPALAVTMQWNPLAQMLDASVLGASLLGHVDDAGTREWAHGQLRQTSLATAISAMQAVCEFTSNDWIGQVDVPTAVVVTTRDRIVPVSRQRKLAAAIPGAVAFELEADHGVCVTAPELFAGMLLKACRSVEDEASQRLGDRSGPAIPAVDPTPAIPPVEGSRLGLAAVSWEDRPVATYPLPNARSRRWKSWTRRSRWLHGRSNPSKLAT
jgi:pimeloyl-ACP methyl ester carboxylesterase